MPPETLTVGEFTRAMDRLHARFDITDARVAQVDARIHDCVTDVAVLRTTIGERTNDEKRSTRNSASGWSAVVAGALVVAVEVIKVIAK